MAEEDIGHEAEQYLAGYAHGAVEVAIYNALIAETNLEVKPPSSTDKFMLITDEDGREFRLTVESVEFGKR